MTVFKTFLKILKKNKAIVILYTALLIFIGAINMQNDNQVTDFTATKPDILIVNNDENEGITKGLIEYLTDNSDIKNVENNDEAINDAVFYRDVNYVIIIPASYSKDFMNGKNPEIEIKSTGDYKASLAEMMLERYVNVSSSYRDSKLSEEEIITKTKETLSNNLNVSITSKVDVTAVNNAAYYFDFASYSILACLIYVICLIITTFNNEHVKKRTLISSFNYKKFNRQLLISNCTYSLILWVIYLIAAFILIGGKLFTNYGVIMIINSFLFTTCATTIAFFLGTLITNKDAINGIVNVIALGSSFLCGAFVPQEILPSFVIKIAHAFPTYYYINTNDKLSTIENYNLTTLKPVLINMGMIVIFSIVFFILTNIVSRRKRKMS